MRQSPLSEQGQTPGKRTGVGEEKGERWGISRAREKSGSENLNPVHIFVPTLVVLDLLHDSVWSKPKLCSVLLLW